MRRAFTSAAISALLVFSGSSFASGGGGFDQSGFSSRSVDQQYELGKSYYRGAQVNGQQLEFCVKKGDSLSKLSRRSVRPYKNGSVTAFVDSLFDCNNPSAKIADLVPEDQGDAVLYYLNKRFKLRLAPS